MTLVHQAALLAQQHHAQIAQGMAMALGWVASHFTALTTHWSAPPKVKSAVATVFAIVGAAVASVIWAPGQPWFDWIKAIGFALMASQASYLLRDLPIIGSAAVQNLGLGLGKQVDGPPPAADPIPTPPVAPAPTG